MRAKFFKNAEKILLFRLFPKNNVLLPFYEKLKPR